MNFNEIMSAFIQILFIILLPSIWWFLTVRGKVPFMEWIGLKTIKTAKNFAADFMDGRGISLFTIFSILIFPLTRSLETATSAFSAMGFKGFTKYSNLQYFANIFARGTTI